MSQTGPWGRVLRYASLVRLSHTVFGLPFCLAAAALAHRFNAAAGLDGLTLARAGWIVLAFTAARTTAMGFNRIADRRIDEANPRTAARELPAGTVPLAGAWALTGGSALVFVVAAWALGPLPLALALPCLAMITVYSLFKRFSWSSHIALGVALALAPGGAWVAVTGSLEGWSTPLWLMGAVATWVAGFDVLYSLQDEQHDRDHGLHSIPARFGRRAALVISGLLHLATVGALVGLHIHEGLGQWHGVGVALISAILVYEHWIVRPNNLSRLDRAFFDLNGYVSLAYLGFVLVDGFVA